MAKSFKQTLRQPQTKEEVIDNLMTGAEKIEKPEPKRGYLDALPKKEKRSKRLQLLITPGLHKELHKVAKQKGVSVNELINGILDDALHG